MEKKCACGGKLVPCTLETVATTLTISVPNGYNFPKIYYVKAFMCESCGKIELYADKHDQGAGYE